MQPDRPQHWVFVYGTLKKGFPNHHVMAGTLAGGPARTTGLHALYVARLPHLIRDEAASHVHGEVYQADDDALARLDAFEGHPDWYRREKLAVTLANGTQLEAWAYFARVKKGRLVKHGDYRLSSGKRAK